jgi:hypothetical protein
MCTVLSLHSDCSPFELDPVGWTHLEVSVPSSSNESVSSLSADNPEAGSSWAPHFDGAKVGILVIWYCHQQMI